LDAPKGASEVKTMIGTILC